MSKFLSFSFLMIFLFSCSPDNNNISTISQTERDQRDDAAIQKMLHEYYFTSNGKIAPCNNLNCDGIIQKSLDSYVEKNDSLGIYWVVNTNVVQSGDKPSSLDSDVVLQYDSFTFVTTSSGNYGTLLPSLSTINGAGIPEQNPTFWKTTLSALEIANGIQESFYEMEGVQIALQDFASTSRGANPSSPVVQFQGVIVVPSRMAFGRNANGNSFASDTSFVLNFELLEVANP